MAQEISWFELSDWSGFFNTRSTFEQIDIRRERASGSRSRQIDLQRELGVRTRSYVYHPNFLSIDLTAGTTLQSLYNTRDNVETDSTTGRLALNGRISVLREKPYRGELFFDRSNPTVSAGFGSANVTTNSGLGMRASLLEPFSPVPMHAQVSRRTSSSEGLDRQSEQTTDRFSYNLSHALDDWGNLSMRMLSVRADANSSSPGALAQSTRSADDSVNINMRARLGEASQHNLNTTLDLERSAIDASAITLPERYTARLNTTLRTKHSDQLRSTARYNANIVDQQQLSSDTHRLSLNLDWAPAGAWGIAGASRVSSSSSRDRDILIVDGTGTVRWDQTTDFGRFTARGSAGLQYQDQRAANSVRQVLGESVTLAGFAETALSVANVVTGSITVQNSTRTVTYVEGTDYAVATVGTSTRLRRLIGSTIGDPETVLVDYRADIGGSFRANQYRLSARASWEPVRWFRANASHAEVLPDLIAGRPSASLRRSRVTSLGLSAEYAFDGLLAVRIGARHDSEFRSETDGSFEVHRSELFMSSAVPFVEATQLRLTARRNLRINTSGQLGDDSDLQGLDLSLRGRPFAGINITATGNLEQDLGGRIKRERMGATLRADWRYRQLSVSGSVSHVIEKQGGVEQQRTFGQLLVRREF